jgi:hypothetical protein
MDLFLHYLSICALIAGPPSAIVLFWMIRDARR